MSPLDGRRRHVGLAAILGSVALVASVLLQATVPAPDAYQFQPALAGPQRLRETVAPALTLAGIAGHAALLVVRGGGSALRLWSRRVAVLTLVLSFVGYAGLFAFDAAVGSLATIAAALFGLLAVIAVGVTGIAVAALGASLARAEPPVERAGGLLLLATPVVGLVGYVGAVDWPLPVLVYAAGMALLGYDCWRASDDAGSGTPRAATE